MVLRRSCWRTASVSVAVLVMTALRAVSAEPPALNYSPAIAHGASALPPVYGTGTAYSAIRANRLPSQRMDTVGRDESPTAGVEDSRASSEALSPLAPMAQEGWSGVPNQQRFPPGGLLEGDEYETKGERQFGRLRMGISALGGVMIGTTLPAGSVEGNIGSKILGGALGAGYGAALGAMNQQRPRRALNTYGVKTRGTTHYVGAVAGLIFLGLVMIGGTLCCYLVRGLKEDELPMYKREYFAKLEARRKLLQGEAVGRNPHGAV